jgi:hypothetical protein
MRRRSFRPSRRTRSAEEVDRIVYEAKRAAQALSRTRGYFTIGTKSAQTNVDPCTPVSSTNPGTKQPK